MSISGLGQTYWTNLLSGTKTPRSPTPANPTETQSASNPDIVTISAQAKAVASASAASKAEAASSSILSLDTDQGQKDIDVDAYFAPSLNSPDGWNADNLPPILLPNPTNINALAKDAVVKLKSLLSAARIPFAPSSVSYDAYGQIQLPSDYPHADQFKQALKDHPVVERELSTVSALTSVVVSMKGSMAFNDEYAKAKTEAEAQAVIARHHALFDGTQHQYQISLRFDEQGEITPFADDQPYLEAFSTDTPAKAMAGLGTS